MCGQLRGDRPGGPSRHRSAGSGDSAGRQRPGVRSNRAMSRSRRLRRLSSLCGSASSRRMPGSLRFRYHAVRWVRLPPRGRATCSGASWRRTAEGSFPSAGRDPPRVLAQHADVDAVRLDALSLAGRASVGDRGGDCRRTPWVRRARPRCRDGEESTQAGVGRLGNAPF